MEQPVDSEGRPEHNLRELYPLYVSFMTQLRAWALTTASTQYARDHYGRDFTPKSFEHFEAIYMFQRAFELPFQIARWRAGFPAWLAEEQRKDDERRAGYAVEESDE